MRGRGLAGLLAATVLLGACSAGGSEGAVLTADVDYRTSPPKLSGDADAVRDRCIAMGLEVLADDTEETVVFSPTSWCMALGMLAEGTSGEGRKQVEAALGTDIATAGDTFNSWSVLFDANDVDPGSIKDELPEKPVVHQANNVVVREGFEVSDDYLAALKRNFDTGMMQADLGGEAGKKVLDQWVREHTGGRIEQSGIKPDPSLVMVLQDALFFASQWQDELMDLGEAPFTRSDGTSSDVPYFGETLSMDYAEHDGWKAGRLRFDGEYHAMFFLPPKTGTKLTPETKAALVNALEGTEVTLRVPAFKAESTTSLLDWFETFGMPALLKPGSLEGIAEGSDLFVDQAVQQAKVEVDEAGVVAVAVTELGVAESAARMPEDPKELILDRPFVMTIGHDEMGIDLFQISVAKVGD